ncbi:hypothetical protein D8674_012642 [Pyrus ussuriensis x Pyrus communis]|uniref:Uncharacterized protein n=1 Tax=Pyrus ussuriensis x Pyrus communis TaxID=2448454 RepID=A0A5N5GFI3_9ROSA|nr:hypothetical protein D8674_012642 [Pyrus ussuriensis x Pyrus communis]
MTGIDKKDQSRRHSEPPDLKRFHTRSASICGRNESAEIIADSTIPSASSEHLLILDVVLFISFEPPICSPHPKQGFQDVLYTEHQSCCTSYLLDIPSRFVDLRKPITVAKSNSVD